MMRGRIACNYDLQEMLTRFATLCSDHNLHYLLLLLCLSSLISQVTLSTKHRECHEFCYSLYLLKDYIYSEFKIRLHMKSSI